MGDVLKPDDDVVSIAVECRVRPRDPWMARIEYDLTSDGLMAAAGGIHLTPAGSKSPGAMDAIMRSLKVDTQVKSELRLVATLLPLSATLRLQPRRPGRGGHTDHFLAQRVAEYLAAVAEAPNRPIPYLVNEHAGTSAAIWRKWIAAASTPERGLLVGRPAAGRAGGQMTDKCRRILAVGEG